MEIRHPYSLNPASSASQNRVLRNTYALLALSMLPTAVGAMAGIQMGFRFFPGSPFIGFLVFMAIAFAFFTGIEKTKNSPLGVVLLLTFTGFMGLMLSGLLTFALSLANGSELILMAAGGTAVVFAAMSTLATVVKRDLSFLGKFLFIGLILAIVASLANIWLQLPALQLAISSACVMIFSLYILFDVQRIVQGGETNYVTATLNLYLDIYNLFVHLLSLLMALFGERE